jgi:hypothetical protein
MIVAVVATLWQLRSWHPGVADDLKSGCKINIEGGCEGKDVRISGECFPGKPKDWADLLYWGGTAEV